MSKYYGAADGWTVDLDVTRCDDGEFMGKLYGQTLPSLSSDDAEDSPNTKHVGPEQLTAHSEPELVRASEQYVLDRVGVVVELREV